MLAKTPVIQCSPCYFAVSALLTNPLPDCSNYSPLLSRPLPHSGSLLHKSLGGRIFTKPLRWRLIPLYCRIWSGTQEKHSSLRKLNNKQRQVSMFLILLFKLLNQFPLVSFHSISILSLLPFSILSLLPLPHPLFLFCSILCPPKIKTLSDITLNFIKGTYSCILFHTMTFF